MGTGEGEEHADADAEEPVSLPFGDDNFGDGRSVFNLSVSGRLPALSEGPGPLTKKQKQRAAGAILWPKRLKTGGFSCILATQATVQPTPTTPTAPLIDPTDLARRPPDRPTDPSAPHSPNPPWP